MKEKQYRHITFVSFSDSSVCASEHLQEIEGVIGVALPPEYRNFVCQCGPERLCVVDLATFVVGKGREVGLSELYGQDKGQNELVTMFENTRYRLHPDLLAIGADEGNDFICLGLRGDRFGKVYFWGKIGLPDEDVSHDLSSTHLVANSFDEFIDGIDFQTEDG